MRHTPLFAAAILFTSCMNADSISQNETVNEVDTFKRAPVLAPKADTLSQKESTAKTFMLSTEELYPDSTMRSDLGYLGFTKKITGIIKAADFSNETLEVQCNDGEYRAIRIEADNLSTYKKSDLRYYMKPGNKIEFICDIQGARELMIVAARFSE